jgi:hypothetical protein
VTTSPQRPQTTPTEQPSPAVSRFTSGSRVRDALELTAACAIVPCALELCSASSVLRWIERVPARTGTAASPPTLAFYVDRVLARAPFVWRRTCLRRAAVLAVLLRRAGHDASVVLGARRKPDGAVEAHAWVRCDGVEPFLEPGDVESFAPLRRTTV